MTSVIKLTALSGTEDESPHCYLLQVDEFRFLLDCGWDEDLKQSTIDSLKKHIHQIDAVLLSHPDPLHLGTLPYLVGKLGLSCPIYATIPVCEMGQMFMYDLYQSRHNTEDFSLFSQKDIDTAFEKIVQLNFHEECYLQGKGHGFQITPFPAGHSIGGTIWRILKDGEEFVYAVDFNHKKDRILDRCMLDVIVRPHLLITGAINAGSIPNKKQNEKLIMDTIQQTVSNGGNVLIATDTAGRVLELSYFLDQMWRNEDSGLMTYSLALLNNVAYNVVEFAISQVESMSDDILKQFEANQENPFQLSSVHTCHSLAELQDISEPKVVLASVPDMQCGFSRELFVQWCGNPKNCIVLTSRTSPGTLSRYLVDNPLQKTITLDVKRRVTLEGAELEEHQKKERERKALICGNNGGSCDDDSAEDDKGRVVPNKCISTNETLNILANVLFIDFEGRSDGESIHKIVKQIQPRNLVMVHGNKKATDMLSSFCHANIHGNVVPCEGKVVDVDVSQDRSNDFNINRMILKGRKNQNDSDSSSDSEDDRDHSDVTKKGPLKALTQMTKVEANESEHLLTVLSIQAAIREHKNNIGGFYKKLKIICVERNENQVLWRQYLNERQQIASDNNRDPNECLAFHGSVRSRKIAREGFKIGLSSKAGYFGPGVYLTEVSSKANQYCFPTNDAKCCRHHLKSCYTCIRYMLVVRTSLGRVCPKTKEEHLTKAPDGFHSVRGVPSPHRLKHSEIVIYNAAQAYPYLLITYQLVKPTRIGIK